MSEDVTGPDIVQPGGPRSADEVRAEQVATAAQAITSAVAAAELRAAADGEWLTSGLPAPGPDPGPIPAA